MRAIIAVILVACVAVVPVVGQQSAPANETPSQFYLRYRAAVPAATSVQQIVEFWSADQRTDFNAAPATERPDLTEIKTFFQGVSGVKVLKESAAPNTATLDAEAMMEGKPVRATVQLVRENGAWKIASGPERWQ
jgi:hypothetical protein